MSLQCRPHMEPSGVPCIRPPMPPGQKRLRLPVMTVNGKEPDAKGNVVVDPPDLTELEERVDGLGDAVNEENRRAVGAEEELGRRIAAEGSRAQSVERGLRDDVSSAQTAIADRYTKRETDEKIAAATPSDYDAVKGRVAAVEAKVPAQATAQNQLADKAFVNSSIATNTAFYISDGGRPFQSLADLESYEGALTNNDYAFVVGRDAAGNTTYTRYKWNEAAETWAEEYVLNNSSFTAEQWAAISSGITSGLVAKLGALPTAAELAQALAQKMPSNATGADIAVSGTDATKIDVALAGKATKADATLTERGYTAWACNPTTDSNGHAYHVEWQDRGWATAWFLFAGDGQTPVSAGYSTDASATRIEFSVSSGSVVATRTALQGYQLGSQSDKPLASEAEAEALRVGKQDRLTFETSVTRNSDNPVKSSGIWSALWGALASLPAGFASLYDWCVSQLAGKASKSDVDPLLFARYYPDGSVKSAAEFTAGIKYDAPDTVNRTITVNTFNNTDEPENDNSELVGRVVIPPFVDAQGSPYISDDGTRYKVVGVGGGAGMPYNLNNNLTAIIAPNTVTNIGNGAFFECTALTSVSLPAVTTIGNSVFGQCSSLTSVDFGDTARTTVPSLDAYSFDDVPTSCKIIVPYTQYDAWIAAPVWRDLQQEFVRHAEKADKPAAFTEGNLAALDANGNPTDSTIPAANVATKASPAVDGHIATLNAQGGLTDGGETPDDLANYALATRTIRSGQVTLDNRASNSVTISTTLSPNTLTINFPTAPTGKLRDFAMRLNIAAGVTAPEIAWPQGVTLENNGGEVPEIADGGTGGSSTILYFSETENNGTTAKFLVKSETLAAITQA